MEKLTTSLQKYVLSIYELSLIKDKVYRIDLAISLGYAKASVTRAVSLLIEKGYIEDHQKELVLTQDALKEIKDIYKIYFILYQLLLNHEFTSLEAKHYALEFIGMTDQNFFYKLHHYHQKHHIHIPI